MQAFDVYLIRVYSSKEWSIWKINGISALFASRCINTDRRSIINIYSRFAAASHECHVSIKQRRGANVKHPISSFFPLNRFWGGTFPMLSCEHLQKWSPVGYLWYEGVRIYFFWIKTGAFQRKKWNKRLNFEKGLYFYRIFSFCFVNSKK